jgi:hypothetical protein
MGARADSVNAIYLARDACLLFAFSLGINCRIHDVLVIRALPLFCAGLFSVQVGCAAFRALFMDASASAGAFILRGSLRSHLRMRK